jgi:uncharacterized protein YqfA (UPF0365 family)
MLLPLLMNIALGSGKLVVDEDPKHVRLVTKAFGVNLVLAKVDKESLYQMTRTPDMPDTRAEAVAQLQKMSAEEVIEHRENKVLADEPVPLPVQRATRQKPQLQLIQGGAA